MAEFFNQLKHLGEEFLESLQHKAKLSTIIPSFVSEKELKEYYEKRMEEVSNFIDKL